MDEFEITVVRSPEDMRKAIGVRRRVFVEEQGVPIEIEVDEHDGDPAVVMTAVQVLGRLRSEAIATGRLIFEGEDGRAHIGRVAVLAEHRGEGYGREVMLALQALARERGFGAVTLAAQTHAIGFYEGLGYVAYGEEFMEAGIPHRWMDLAL